MHLVGFIIRIYHVARSAECQKNLAVVEGCGNTVHALSQCFLTLVVVTFCTCCILKCRVCIVVVVLCVLFLVVSCAFLLVVLCVLL